MFLIPMMGKSSRFYQAGYNQPKYMLPLPGSNLFNETVKSFKSYFSSDLFVFTIPDKEDECNWILKQINFLGIDNFEIIKLKDQTNGQADTIFQTLDKISPFDEELNIFNIDTILTNFKKELLDSFDGYLEVFEGNGDHWSFADIDKEGVVLKTAEKKRISSYCSNGFYNFKSSEIFIEGFLKQEEFNKKNKTGEIYIAPIYNFLINHNYRFKVKKIFLNEIIFSGTPFEYENMPLNKL